MDNNFESWEEYSLPLVVHLWNEIMNFVIRSAGAFLIFCFGGMVLFIISQVFPLIRSARVSHVARIILPTDSLQQFAVLKDRGLVFVPADESKLYWTDGVNVNWSEQQTPNENKDLEFLALKQDNQLFVVTRDGILKIWTIWCQDQELKLLEADSFYVESYHLFSEQGFTIRDVSFAENPQKRVIVLLLNDRNGSTKILIGSQERKNTLLNYEGWSKLSWAKPVEVNVNYIRVLVPKTADSFVALQNNGVVDYYLLVNSEEVRLQQSFLGIHDRTNVTAWSFVLGDVSLILGGNNGELRRWSLVSSPTEGKKQFVLTGVWAAMPGAVNFIYGNQTNKNVVVTSDTKVKIVNATTGITRWVKDFEQTIINVSWNSAANTLAVCKKSGTVEIYSVTDPHPESSFKAFFGPVWYEGRVAPGFIWQSTSGTDDFEPKFSLTPLIFGSLKGVFYALLFALPLSILGALYVSQMMHPLFRSVIKPTMEWMASIPSVVLGFIGALWLAPVLATRITSLLIVTIAVPLAVMIISFVWIKLFQNHDHFLGGYEWLFLIPISFFLAAAFWQLGPALEKILFSLPTVEVFKDNFPVDFRVWLREVLGLSYEQRNAFVVGLMMGYVVIPVIFSIAEEVFSNVPSNLKLAAQSLGASRWQVASMVIFPVALPGVFSAVLVGVGRAIGETMIVVMLSGNTAVLDLSPFTGMRPLSANIAVEIPEAARETTHYRVLFLNALILFAICLMLNSVAEFVRDHFRRKIKGL